jgi:hypothetical protein
MTKHMERLVMAVLVVGLLGAPGVAAAQNRGVQFTPDGKRILVNKDVGTERWAITRNEDGSATGNVFRSDGGDPAFIYCAPLAAPNAFDCFGADACTDASGAQRGIQGTPDDHRVLVQKDVGTERWAISLNFDDGTATGNIFRADGGDPAFVVCTPSGAPNGFACSGADKCRANPCTDPFEPIGDVTLPATFFAVPDPCVETYTALGSVTLPASFFVPATTVTFGLSVSAPVQAAQLRVTYPTAKGGFDGTAGEVSCTSDGGGIFTANDDDAAGRLIFSLADASNLAFPITVRCAFSANGAIAPGDFTVLVEEVTQNNAPGDASVMTVAVGVN